MDSHGDNETLRINEINALTQKIIGCAIEVHRNLGPGLLEQTYESALCIEFEFINYQRQCTFPIIYKEKIIGEYRVDLIVENLIIIEVKSVERFDPIFEAQLLTYLKVTGKKIGLLINFNTKLLKNGIKRLIL